MKTLRVTENLTPDTEYLLTASMDSAQLKNCVGQTLVIDGLALLEDVKRDTGEVIQIARVAADGEVYATSSPTFVSALEAAWDFSERRNMPIKALEIRTGHSKNGRDYLTCKAIFN